MELFKKHKILNMIQNYNNDFFESLDNNIDILIEAFTNYYGEEYRNIISEKIKCTYFFTFISKSIIELMINGYNKLNLDEKASHKDFAKIIKYYKNKKHFSKFFENNTKLTGIFKNQVIQAINENDDSCAFQLTNINSNYEHIYTVFLGIGVNDETIIHELNHVITNSILAYTKNSKIELIEKIGTTTSLEMAKGEALEEIINEKTACIITDIFHNLGGKISNFNLYSIDTYSPLFPLIDRFYYKYCELIKLSRITDNQKILFSRIDAAEFEKYQQFITYELNYVIKNHKISFDAITKANLLINKLDKKNKQTEDIDNYIKKLQEQKKIIKLLYNQNNIKINNSKSR